MYCVRCTIGVLSVAPAQVCSLNCVFVQDQMTLKEGLTCVHMKTNGRCAYISAMLSGRLAGISVRPLPRQSTMLLLQVHIAGQEPPPVLHGCRLENSW